MKLTDNVLRSFRVAKVFRENSDKINCFDFSSNGETVISSSDDDSIVLYDCQEGKPKRTLYSKKYGVDLIRYTHAANTVVYSSNKIDGTFLLEQLACLSIDTLCLKLSNSVKRADTPIPEPGDPPPPPQS
uniref:Uncharacterized protein n=1 Tax=Lepisosteus oculatus TaxID=7918 RepID=W5NAW7_LEPOC